MGDLYRFSLWLNGLVVRGWLECEGGAAQFRIGANALKKSLLALRTEYNRKVLAISIEGE
jgi:hypothetical protein